MVTAQDIFKRAQTAYEEAERLIMKLSLIAKATDKNFDINMPLKKFDIILQAVLLDTILADGKIVNQEAAFAKLITKHADILELLKKETDISLEWGIIHALKIDTAREVSSICRKMASSTGKAFIECFALIDAVIDEEDYIKELFDYMTIILMSAMAIDGKIDEIESKKSFDSLRKLLLEPWNTYKILIKKANEEKALKRNEVNTSSMSKNSLKEVYLKKICFNVKSDKLVNAKSDRKHILDYVIYIETERGSGSGFIISKDGFAVTCAHVIRGCKEIYIKVNTQEGKSDVLSAKAIKVSDEYDMAIIKIEAGDYYYSELDFDRALPDLGEEIAIYGYPFGKRMNDDVMSLNISMAKGYISSNQVIKGVKKSLLDISAKSGNSGSPIISLENGKVIGLLSGSIINGDIMKEEVNYMINIMYLKRLIE